MRGDKTHTVCIETCTQEIGVKSDSKRGKGDKLNNITEKVNIGEEGLGESSKINSE